MRDGPDILCLGSVLWDVIGHAQGPLPPGADVPGRVIRRPGGVAFNIARALARAGLRPALLGAVGDDAEGDALIRACDDMGLITGFLHRPAGRATDRYVAIEGAAGLLAAVADTRTLEAAGASILDPLADGRLGAADAPWPGPLVLDGNLPAALLAEISQGPLFAAAEPRIALASTEKAARLRPLLALPRATFHANRAEAAALCDCRFANAEAAAAGLVARGAARAIVTDGGAGVAEAGTRGRRTVGAPGVAVTQVTGAGDALMAAHIAAELRGATPDEALRLALAAATAHVTGASDE